MQIRTHKLSNGLRLLHYQDKHTQLTTLNLMYHVGSRNEHPEHTGIAHLFEHLMFSGSKNVPDFDRVIQEAAGENNAWTNPDVTNYYITLPSNNIETALYAESDRMLNLNIHQENLDIQRQVVCEEFKQRYLNQPYGDAGLLMRPLMYGTHPYAWATIGKSLSHIEQFSLEDVSAFYEQYYAPDNAVLALCGKTGFEEAVDLTEKWFGDIPSGTSEASITRIPPLETQTKARSLSVQRPVPVDMLYKCWHAPSVTEAGYMECDLLTDILAGGPSARFYQHLVKENRLFSDLDIYVGGEALPGGGSIQFSGKPAQGVSLETADEMLQIELEKLFREALLPDELQKVKNKFESAYLFRNTNCQHLATQLCWYETLGSAESYLQEPEKAKAVTEEKIQQVAARIFRPENASTLYYRRES